MSALPASPLPSTPALVLGRASAIPGWRYALVVLGAGVGLGGGIGPLFTGTLPFFLLPITSEFGWGRGSTAMAAVLAMLGVSLASPFVGRLFDRYRSDRVIGVSVLLLAAGVFTMSAVPASLVALGGVCLWIGLSGAATTMVGYVSVLPRWFDRRLGLALGLVGLVGATGMALAPFVSSRLITAFGWRSAYQMLAGIALALGALAFMLLRPRHGDILPVPADQRASDRGGARGGARGASGASAPPTTSEGMTLPAAIRTPRFWLLVAVTFLVPFSVLGVALHGAALFNDRGFTPAQAATGIALGGLGAVTARLVVGALLDRFHAPRVAAVVFFAAATGLLLNSSTTSFPLMCVGTLLGGAAMGAEGDLLPFMVRRYFGMRAFGAVFGSMHSAYALGGVLGPIAYGTTFDQAGTYRPVMLACSALCAACALGVIAMGWYRYRADAEPGKTAHEHAIEPATSMHKTR